MAKRQASAAEHERRSKAGKKAWAKKSVSEKTAAIRRLTGKAKSTGGRARSAVSHAVSRGRGFFASLTAKKVAQGFIVIDALSESSRKAQQTYADSWVKAQHVIAPLIDAGVAAKAVGVYVDQGLSGLAQDLANWRFMGGKAPAVTIRRLANSAPHLIAAPLAFRSYRELRQIGGDSGKENLLPRTAALTGIRIRNVRTLGHGPWLAGVRDAGKPLLDAVVGSPVAPVVAGRVGSKVIEKLVHV